MKLSIYNIEQEYRQLVGTLIEQDGELTPELETALQINREQMQTKGVCYGFVVKQLESESEIIDNEIKRLQALKKRNEANVQKLKDKLTEAMQLFEIEKIETPLIKIGFRASESMEIDNMDNIPSEYMVTKVTVTPDKVAIKKAIKAGDVMSGAILITNQNIQIK